MYRKTSLTVQFIQLMLFGLVLFGITWMNYQLAAQTMLGRDFAVQWAAGRALAFQAEPLYGRRVDLPVEFENLPAFAAVETSFNTPIYSVLLLLPFILVGKYSVAYSLYLLISEMAVLGIFLGLMLITGWRMNKFLLVITQLALWLGFYTIQAFLNGNLIILAGLFLVLALLSLNFKRFELSGILFALSTIQIHILWPIYLLVFIWAFSKRYWSMLVWFIGGNAILIVLGMFIMPDWPLEYARVLWQFKDNFALQSLGSVLLDQLPGVGKQLGWVFTGLLLINLAVEWFMVRGKDLQWFIWTVCLTSVDIIWIGIPVHPSMFFILSLPLLLVLSVWIQRTGVTGHRVVGLSLIGYLFLSWLLAYRTGINQEILNPGPAHYFLLPAIVWTGLYWTRWWAIRPQRLFIEELRGSENQP